MNVNYNKLRNKLTKKTKNLINNNYNNIMKISYTNT